MINVKKYNPGFLTDDDIVESFCVRTDEFESIVELLRELHEHSSSHSLVVGPRGSGKTHLLLRIAAEVRRDSQLSGLFPVVFAEESYEVTTCGEFWLECLGHLAEQAPADERSSLRRTYEDVRDTKGDPTLADRCLGALLDFADRHDKRLLLIVENLNMLFADMPDADTGWRLRKTLQTEPRVVLLASATSRFEEIDDPDHALFDLFRVITLRPLDTAACETLFRSISSSQSSTRAIRPLEILTGGNARLVAIIARFGHERSFRALMTNLLDLVDDHTEYFKSHLEALPTQERRVYLALAKLWKPASTREIAELARLDTNRCSAFLARLVDRGVVTVEGGTANRKQYYLTERLYNIYYLLRRGGQSDRVVRALIDFMVYLYTPADFSELLARMLEEGSSQDFLEYGILRHTSNALMEGAFSLFSAGRYDESLETINNAVQVMERNDTEDVEIIAAFGVKCLVLAKLSRFSDVVSVNNDIISRYDSNRDGRIKFQVTMALLSKGAALHQLEKPNEAVDAYDEGIKRATALGEQTLKVLSPLISQCKGLSLLLARRPAEALLTFDSIAEEDGFFSQSLMSSLKMEVAVGRAAALEQLHLPLEEDEVARLLREMAEEGELRQGVLQIAVYFAAVHSVPRALEIIRETGTEKMLAPLVAALQFEKGETPEVPKEVREIAMDVRQELRTVREKHQQGLYYLS